MESKEKADVAMRLAERTRNMFGFRRATEIVVKQSIIRQLIEDQVGLDKIEEHEQFAVHLYASALIFEAMIRGGKRLQADEAKRMGATADLLRDVADLIEKGVSANEQSPLQ